MQKYRLETAVDVLSMKVSKEALDFRTRQITQVENFVQDKVKVKDQYQYLQTIYGVGKILSLTIMLETGPVERFIKVGNYTSYCRKVPTQWTSNNKTKGKGNKKNGKEVFCYTPYLSTTLILMGDWCSEEIADTLTFEISARVMTLRTLEQF